MYLTRLKTMDRFQYFAISFIFFTLNCSNNLHAQDVSDGAERYEYADLGLSSPLCVPNGNKISYQMSQNCQIVVFSNRAYNAIIRESFDKDSVETGGILLGHVLDNGAWIVMEVLPPGVNSVYEFAYFEYDDKFVNYLAQSVANQYRMPLDLLGLWHKHLGSLDYFSSTDDATNTTFAMINPKGVISGLVNIDPRFRLTMYHLDRPTDRLVGRPNYDVVEVEVGDDIIPEEYFELRYFNGEEDDLHPEPHSIIVK